MPTHIVAFVERATKFRRHCCPLRRQAPGLIGTTFEHALSLSGGVADLAGDRQCPKAGPDNDADVHFVFIDSGERPPNS
ncbi:hypothetical protein ACWGTI_31605 [Mesorhizobium sp. ArgA1]